MKLYALIGLMVLAACNKSPELPPGGQCAEKPKQAAALDITLINGTVVDQKEYPSNVYISMGNGSCSATVVGERALFTASHCVANGGGITFKDLNGVKYSGKCTHAPGYPANATNDWTMCLLDKPYAGQGIKYESFNSDASAVKMGTKILMTGYGCTQSPGTGGNDGKLRIGWTTVVGLPSGSNNDIVTRNGGSACYGDSGSSVFVEGGNKRYIAGVVSRGDIKVSSYLPSVTQKVFVDFVNKWATDNSQKICGIHADATNCRNEPACAPQPYVNIPSEVYIKKGEGGYIGMPAVSGQSFKWSNGYALDDAMSSNPYAKPCQSDVFTVTASTACGTVTKSVKVTVK